MFVPDHKKHFFRKQYIFYCPANFTHKVYKLWKSSFFRHLWCNLIMYVIVDLLFFVYSCKQQISCCVSLSWMFSTVFIVVFFFPLRLLYSNSLFPTDHWRVLVCTYASFDFWVGNMNYIYRIQLLRTKHNNRNGERERDRKRENTEMKMK